MSESRSYYKDTALALCGRRDIEPSQLIYVALDGMTVADLRRVLRFGRELTRSMGDQRRIWILDEVTALKGWTAELKYQRDNPRMLSDDEVGELRARLVHNRYAPVHLTRTPRR